MTTTPSKTDTTTAPTTEETEAQNAEAIRVRDEAMAQAVAGGTEKSAKQKNKTLGALTDMDLVDQDTGHTAPLSATTANLQGTISNVNGRPLLKVAIKGYIGEEPVTLLAEDADEFAELVAALEKAAGAQKREFAKRRKS